MRHIRGQSTVEYILLVTAVIAVMIVFASTPNGAFQQQLGTVLNTTAGDMVQIAAKVQGQ